MYSLTFCVRFLLPERHQRKTAVQAAAVMLRTPLPSTANQRRASNAHFLYTARNFENAPRHLPDSGQQRAQTPPSRPFALYRKFASIVYHQTDARVKCTDTEIQTEIGGVLSCQRMLAFLFGYVAASKMHKI